MENTKNNYLNLLVLTTGLSGSSAVTGLLCQAGFWPGDVTEFKDNSAGRYETYENSRFVELNDRLVQLSGIKLDHKFWYRTFLRQHFAKLADEIDLTDFKAFVADCAQHQPWILKDPKLWVTLDFWLPLLSEQNVSCVIARRASASLWLSQTLKRIIYDYVFLKQSEELAFNSIVKRLEAGKIKYINLDYEDLINRPGANLSLINKFLQTGLTMEDWGMVYRPVGRESLKVVRWFLAILIYLKNYKDRIK